MNRSTPSSPVRDLPPGVVHQPQRPGPPAPFGLDPAITDVMDVVLEWMRALFPDWDEARFPPDQHAIWEVSWRLREICLAAGTEPAAGDEGQVLFAISWWRIDQESGDEMTRKWSELAA